MEHRQDTTLTYLWTALAALWLSVFPLWQGGTYSSITRAKWEGTLLFAVITFGAVLFAIVYSPARHRHLPFPLHRGHLTALVLFLLMGVSALFGAYAGQVNKNGELCVWMGSLRYEGMATQLCYFAIFVMMSLHPMRRDWLMHLCSLSLILQCAVVVGQYLDMNPLGLFPAGLSTRTNYEFQGTIGNIDMVSGYLSLMLPLLLGSFVTAKKGGWLWLLAGTLGVWWMLCMTVQSGIIALGVFAVMLLLGMLWKSELRSRGLIALGSMLLCYPLRRSLAFPWLDGVDNVTIVSPGVTGFAALAAALVLMLLGVCLLRPHKPLFTLSGWQVLAIFAVLVLVGMAVLLSLPLTEENGGLWEIREVLMGRGQDSFGSYRLGVWRQTLNMAKEHLLLGNGPDTFWFAFNNYLKEVGVSFPETFDNPHNEYLALLANDGLPALICYLALLLFTLRRCGKDHSKWALLVALAAYAVQGAFSFSICIVAPMFWAVMGMANGQEETTAPILCHRLSSESIPDHA